MKPILSFEIFPPKETTKIESIYSTIDALAPLRPDFISVTYGAGGSNQNNTIEIASVLRNKYNIRPVAHLTCVGATESSIDMILDRLNKEGVEHILALRGDLPHENALGDFKYATDLVAYIKKKEQFSIVGACYPEKHIEAICLEDDIMYLKEKVEAGAEMLVSQLFFDNDVFFEWVSKVRKAGITVPIIAGIMPITSEVQLKRMQSLCGATIPDNIKVLIDAYSHNQAALKDVGTTYATMQIIDLLARGVDGIHLYTMNKAELAKKIVDNISSAYYARCQSE
ncbi:MAG: methylenetetrahydrofolate reductase [NAD(P)H] [Cellulosilyticaceae bacterium]